MNLYFLSNDAVYVKKEAERLDTYIKRIGFGDLSENSAVWMKKSVHNQEMYQILDAILGFGRRKIPCYQSFLFPEDLLWKDYEHLFVMDSPSNLKCMVKLILGYGPEWLERTEPFPDGMIYMVTVKKDGARLTNCDFRFYYDSRED